MEPSQCLTPNLSVLRQCAVVAFCLAFMSELAAAGVIAQVRSNYDKLPLGFEANQGQTDARVKFLSRGNGYTLFLTPSEAVLHLRPREREENSEAVLRMQMIGANPSPRILGKEALPGRVNYLVGKDPSQWHTKIPTYGKVAYEGVYPGVDLMYYGNQGQLEYDFVVAPSADPHDIKLAFKGSGPIEISPAGELVLHTENGAIRMHKPVIYQEINGIRKSIDGSYILNKGQTVGFQVAAYDTAHPLIIDPVLVYSTYLGGTYMDECSSIAVDLQGRIYVAGWTSSTDFPALNSIQPNLSSRAGSSDFPVDAFVAQLTPDGTTLRYATFLGGSEYDSSQGIVVDPQGHVTVAGLTLSPDFPIHNALQPAFFGKEFDVFVAQLTADGAALRYSTYLGGSDSDKGSGIAVDLQGRAYVTGDTGSLNFPTKNALQPTLHLGPGASGRDAFVAQLTADGKALHYSTYLGGRSDDWGHDIAVDPQGQAYVSGETTSTDFPIKNAFQPAFRGGNDDVFGAVVGKDVFIAKLTANGKTLSYSTYLGGSGNETGHGLAVDLRGQAVVTGSTDSPDFPSRNALQPTFGGGYSDAFVTQLAADGRALSYSTYLGGSDLDGGSSIAVDQHGQAYVTGSTSSPDFPTVNALQPAFAGNIDVFVAKIRNDNQP